MSWLCTVDADQLPFIAATTAVLLSKQFEIDDLNVLACLLTAIGDNLAVIAARQVCDSSNNQSDTQPNDQKSTQSASQADNKTDNDSGHKSTKTENRSEMEAEVTSDSKLMPGRKSDDRFSGSRRSPVRPPEQRRR